MNLIKIGQTLFSTGFALLVLGFLILKFPNLLIKLPTINLDNKIIFPLGTIIAVTIIFSVTSILFNYLAKLIK